ncbi:glycoside hydrolase family 97 protein [Chitinophaga tropicalis]|uniref:Glycoside hydrolase family 97 protein n=1 Tax=Chitinophaga tropicalis TaxID=2683588 RepID=A0A7K1U3N4_9BACT|nr:glycoside hydrolase family 97 protein [Chitinophaga tropicalis]MVT08949.1 glycoside hydrolase family 97 protein [Chitinophaga tropicalis]
MKGMLPLIFCIAATGVQAQELKLSSPDNKISITINNSESLRYSVAYNGISVIHPSPLGFSFRNEPDMGKGLILRNSKQHTVNETWQPVVRAKHETVTNHYNELEIQLIEKDSLKRRIDVFFRAYNDGIAFRYQLYRSEKIGHRELTKELTGFYMPQNAKAWIENLRSYTTSQEMEFRPFPLDSVQQHTIAGLPMLIEVDKQHYAAITEANIDNYPGFYLGRADSGTDVVHLATKLSPLPGEKEDGIKARFADKQLTPWRVVMLGSKPVDLITSELIQNLNEPCAIADPSWIKPGISAWDHWWSGEVKMEMPVIKQYIDLASRMGWPYMLIDWQWYGPFNKPEADITKPAPQINMKEILEYARSKNVRCWLWLYSSDVNRNNNFEAAMALYEQWGITGIKIDFMDRDDQDMVNWYREIIKAAAAHHLMVDFHGAYKPDGITRTWPNMITREGVLGEEYSKFSTRINATHNVTLPFTRMLAGQMDYTPGGFLNVTKKEFKNQNPTMVMNTRCAELAKFVIYESPFMVDCEHPDHIKDQPGEDFLKIVPTVWDDSKGIDGYPGEFIVMAKRKGNDWFIAAMTNESKRTVKIVTDFLPAGNYEVEIWQDARQPQQLKHEVKKTIKAGAGITISMAESGGYVARLRPVQQ